MNRASSLAHYRVAEVFMLQNNYQSAANAFPGSAERRPGTEVDRSMEPHQSR